MARRGMAAPVSWHRHLHQRHHHHRQHNIYHCHHHHPHHRHLSFPVIPCRSLSFPVIPCRSLSFPVVPCRSLFAFGRYGSEDGPGTSQISPKVPPPSKLVFSQLSYCGHIRKLLFPRPPLKSKKNLKIIACLRRILGAYPLNRREPRPPKRSAETPIFMFLMGPAAKKVKIFSTCGADGGGLSAQSARA